MRKLILLVALASALFAVAAATAADWPSFRGPNGSGVADGAALATSWDADGGRNVLWRTELAGGGFASPVLWQNRLYVTTFEEVAGKDDTLRWNLLAIDRASGKVQWSKTVVEEPRRLDQHRASSQANASPAVDGKRIVTIVGASTLAAYDLSGKELWRKDLGLLDQGMASDRNSQWGHASSPLLWQDKVYVQVDRHRDSYLAAYDAASGKELWRDARQEKPSWSTPAIYRSDAAPGGVGLVTASPGYTRGYDPNTGAELWRFNIGLQVMVPVPVVSDDLIYIAGGYPRGQPIRAIRTSAKGDVSVPENARQGEHVAFISDRGGPYVPSLLLYRGTLYGCTDEGILSAYDAASGKRLWRERVGGTYSASPVAGDGKIYLASEEGDVRVVRAGERYELLATIPHGERLMATPAIGDGTLYVRGGSFLLAVQEGAGSKAASDQKKARKR
ncbi:MAG: PQQ-binding-like beta-propeller repeat protein [Acidobacteriota bacterium]